MKQLFITKIEYFCLIQPGAMKTTIQKPIIDLAEIPAGNFIMGSPVGEEGRKSNEIQHKVSLNAFKLSKFEVTFEQYDLFCEAAGMEKPADEGWGRGKRPVIHVSWEDAKAFATWLECRLPTEAEWEYACRAGSTTPFSTGNNLTTAQANFDGNYPYGNSPKGEFRASTLPVGSFAPNAWGLYDMHGNVWEWCHDWYDESSSADQKNPKGPDSGTFRVFRGGGWRNYAQLCRSAFRYRYFPDYRHYNIGFRLASDV